MEKVKMTKEEIKLAIIQRGKRRGEPFPLDLKNEIISFVNGQKDKDISIPKLCKEIGIGYSLCKGWLKAGNTIKNYPIAQTRNKPVESNDNLVISIAHPVLGKIVITGEEANKAWQAISRL